MEAMEPDPAAVGASSSPPAASPPRQLQPQDDDDRGAVEVERADPASPERCAAGGDPNCAPPPSPVSAAPQPPPQQQPAGEDAAASCEVEEEEQKLETEEVPGEALRFFMEEFGDQGENPPVLSPRLKEIATPDRPAALRFLGEKYNSLVERYKQQVVKCEDECVPRYDGLKKKYMDECAERKRIYNELIELRGNIRVFCRCRPLNSDEVTRGCSSVVEIKASQETNLQFISSGKERKTFTFDRVFGPEDNQEAVFSETVPVVRSVMEGFNVCIFAYGQTGTGKTFTMEGIPENRGVNYRALEELFRMSEERKTSITYTFSVSILEVYNEKIRDLLDESNDLSKRLDIKQSADGTQEVPGLIEAPIYNIDHVWEKLKFGARNRSVESTNANELSSRSHSLVRVTVRSENLLTGQTSRSHMWMVDLAGSERVAKTGVEGDRLKESQFINKSLSAMGDVISALASKNSHIPYRNSKLTHLLQSSLGGDCKTLMFVQISPSSTDSGETLCSLNFASRVRAVEHGPARKQADPAESLKLKHMSEKLCHVEKENAQLKKSLQSMQLQCTSREKTLIEKRKDAEQACKNYQQRIRELENELGNERKAARDSARSSRPPLVPMRQRQPQGRNNYHPPPSGPSRSRFSKAPTVQNKENHPVMTIMNKAHPGADNNAVGKARRVSLTPVIRQIPIQPKRRSSLAILPSLSEQLSVLNEKRAASGLSHVHMPRRPVAAFGSIPAEPVAGRVTADATPDGAKLRRIDFGSSSKFTSPPPMLGLWSKMVVTPQQKLGEAPAGGPWNSSKLCFSIQKRVLVPSPSRAKPSVPSGMGIFNPALREQVVVGRAGKAVRVVNNKRRQSVI